jgi:uncharacterized damage-inducible protein DinB
MSIGASMLPEFDHEMANTRKTLERVPDDKFAWKPHEKSSAMGALAQHLGNIPGWVGITLEQDSFDTAPDGQPVKQEPLGSTAAILETFDKNVAKASEAIAAVKDERLFTTWSLLANGRAVLTMPRIACLRSFVLNHSIHHRAQLGVYLRRNDIPVPSIYGPSADEGAF